MSVQAERAASSLDPENLDNYDILYTGAQIRHGIKRLAREISRDYQGKELTIVSILDGAVFFTVDLTRELDLQGLIKMEFLGVASYEGTATTEKPVVTKKLRRELTGKDVLLIEDTLDTGITLDFVQKSLLKGKPNSLKTAVLVRKQGVVRKKEASVDYIIFDDVKGWLTGYGFDVDGKFRELRDIYVKKDTV